MSKTKKQLSLALVAGVSKETVDSLIESVLDAAQPKNSRLHPYYLLCIKNIKVSGFRPGQEPPKTMLVKKCVEVIPKSSRAFMDFLAALLMLDEGKTKIIREIIKNEPTLDPGTPFTDPKDFTKSVEAIVRQAEEEKRIDSDRESLYLLCGACLLIPSQEEKAAKALAASEKALSLFEAIKAIPSDDPFWNCVQPFIKSIICLKEEKIGMETAKKDLAAALESFHAEYGGDLADFFELPIDGWRIECLIPGREDLALGHLSELSEMLHGYGKTREKKPATAKERKELAMQLEDLEKKIDFKQNELAECFGETDLENDKDPIKKGEAGEVSSGAEDKTKAGESKGAAEASGDGPAVIKEETDLTGGLAGGKKDLGASLADDDIDQIFDKEERIEKSGKANEAEKNLKADYREELPEGQVDPILKFLDEGDLAGAYWQTRALEEKDRLTPLPSWLIAAMEASRYLVQAGFRASRDFTYPIKYTLEDESPLPRFGALGAGLLGALVVPASGSLAWLIEQAGLPNLNKVIRAITEFSRVNIPLTKMELLALSGKGGQDKTIAGAALHCKEILDTHTNRRFGLMRVNRIWKGIFGETSPLRNILLLCSGDRREKLAEIKRALGEWQTNDQIIKAISTADARARRQRDHALTLQEQSRLSRLVTEVVEAAEEWVGLVESLTKEGRSWKHEHIGRLVGELNEWVPKAREELSKLLVGADREKGIGLNFLLGNLRLLSRYLGLEGGKYENRDSWCFSTAEDRKVKCDKIEEILAKRLLWFPNLELQDNCLPTQKDLEDITDIKWKANPQWSNLNENVYRNWLDKQDHRFLELILLGLDIDESLKDELRAATVREQMGSRDTLQLRIRDTTGNIERALFNGVISEDERVEYASAVESIKLDNILNYAKEIDKLNGVDKELEKATIGRIEHLTELWADLSPQLEKIASADMAGRFRGLVDSALQERNTRVVDEYLADARERLIKNEKLELVEKDIAGRDYLQEFSAFRTGLKHGGDKRFSDAKGAMLGRRNWARLRYGEIPEKQLEQTKMAFEAWRNLLQRRKKDFKASIYDLFTFLGFTVPEEGDWQESKPESGGYHHLRLKMDAGDQARPFPQFGSLVEPTFDVLMVWERPGADNIGSAIHEAKLRGQSSILIYFGRIGEMVRQNITRMTRKRRLSVAVLDETLFLFLTGERDARLKAFLHCAVPYGTVIPYTPRIAGDVPSEIFYGREDALDQLVRRDGSCLLYGGRQMGKSALLRQVARRAHNPARRQYAWVDDVKAYGDNYSNKEPADIWSRLWEHLLSEKLVSGRFSTNDEVVAAVERLLRRESDLQIILMLDEADNFLNQDALEGFQTVTQLRGLMAESKRRFKVIFAGLQHVQRFQSLPNQPLAHFGDSILVGPLDSRSAVSLVREPLEALGFKLADDCVYLILSFTNYHPGLIQLFCYHLLERLYNKMPNLPSPYKPVEITKEDVESIYRQANVRGEIRERFEWTLALDPRYQVVTWSMIDAQTHVKDSFSKKFSVAELFEMAKEFWSAEFERMTHDAFRGVLRELRGLGVLLMDGNKYRLKSPNLVHLMGTEEDILNRLYEFLDRPATHEIKPNSFHHLIDDEKKIYSVFNFEQARNIDRQGDFRVILASKALGRDIIEKSIKNLYTGGNRLAFKRINLGVHSSEDMTGVIEKERDKAQKGNCEGLVLYQIVAKTAIPPFDAMASAYEYYRQRQGRKRSYPVSFFFVLNPSVCWHANLKEQEFLSELEDEGMLISIKRWNQWGIGQRLDDADLISNESIRKVLMDASGGWPFLIEEIFLLPAGGKNIQNAAKEVKRQLARDENYRKLFLAQLELPVDPVLNSVLQFFCKHGSVPMDLIIPEMMEKPYRVNKEQLEQAFRLMKLFDLLILSDENIVMEPTLRKVFRL